MHCFDQIDELTTSPSLAKTKLHNYDRHDKIMKYCDDRIGCDKRVLLGAQLPMCWHLGEWAEHLINFYFRSSRV